MQNIFLTFLGNLVGLFAASYFISGFAIAPKVSGFLLAVLLTLLHLTIKPILKFFAWPIVVLTLGLGLILINALVLGILDFISKNLTIKGLEPLILGTLLVTGANLIIHLLGKREKNS